MLIAGLKAMLEGLFLKTELDRPVGLHDFKAFTDDQLLNDIAQPLTAYAPKNRVSLTLSSTANKPASGLTSPLFSNIPNYNYRFHRVQLASHR